MESDDSPGEDGTGPDGESDHVGNEEAGESTNDGPSNGVNSVRPEAEDSTDQVADQWHSDPPEGWNEDRDGGVFGAGPEDESEPPPPIEPGSPSLENALFVLLGVLTSIGILVHVVVSF